MLIYIITNKENNKVYVGQTIQSNPKMRWYAHLADARRGKKTYLYDSIRKYGKESFNWEVIDTAKNLDELNEKEAQWLAHYRQKTVVYNNREAGNNKTHSPESIERMRQAQLKRHRENNVGGWTRRDGGAMKGKAHPIKGTSGLWSHSEDSIQKYKKAAQKRYTSKEYTQQNKDHLQKLAAKVKGKTWKLVDGKRVWMDK
jgi:group I intron endonuclease